MKHHTTQALFNYWTRKRGRHRAPVRSDIDPADIRRILADTFILTADFVNEIRVRLAGTRVCALFARELKGTPFVQLWDLAGRVRIRELAATVAEEANPVVAGVAARTAEGSHADLELLLLPLYHRGRLRVRLLGVLTPLVVPYWLGTEHITTLALGTTRHLGGAIALTDAPSFAKAAPEAGRPRLTVHDGGRKD